MSSWILRVEGVNFAATIDDTNDLSTMRGGSLALLNFHEQVGAALKGLAGVTKAEKVFSGASLCAFRVEGTLADFAETARRTIAGVFSDPQYGWNAKGEDQAVPLNYLTVVVDAAETAVASVEDKTIDAGIDKAEARNHARQFRQWTIAPLPAAPVHANATTEADRFEKVRPATAWIRAPKGHLLNATAEDTSSANGSDIYHTSASVAARRNYGRDARQKFYGKQLGEGYAKLLFTDSVSDIAEELPADYRLPVSLRSKIAVFYADGNKFGSIRKEVGAKAFSDRLDILRKGLLKSILDWYVAGEADEDEFGPLGDAFAVYSEKRSQWALRFETLMWGGDELLFVMPAWLAVPFTQGFFEMTKAWEIGGVPVSHAVAVAIAHHKTPIRQLKAVAKRAADLAKNASPDLRKASSVTFEVYESLAPPDTDSNFEAERLRLYGNNPAIAPDDQASALARLLAIPGDEFTGAVRRFQEIQRGFPRSQIYAALRAMREARGLWDKEAEDAARVVIEKYARFDSRAVDCLHANRLPSFGLGKAQPDRPLSLDLAMLATFWDYFEPFGELKAFPANSIVGG
ncbi:hypothetical protein [Pleomorphomonas sp. NRK KF1]|uniref:hypothetical protein n=1 Tax=Pleomorphomonas sp. NRK KF1 TaxID=2943000 RepID=UPI002043B386|nr:hypothetical protein [Pleomorphomonas sp. NRK KF1]MCM5552396.1 hypothetical protein [Pleomorphomonas sp. NRK KF1]